MGCMKNLIIKVFFIPFLYIAALDAQTSLNKFFSTVSGTALALAINIPLEYASTVSHELGHALVNKLFSGDKIDIGVEPNLTPTFLVQPWTGWARCSGNSTKLQDAFTLIAGPLAGIGMTQLQLILLTKLRKKYNISTSKAKQDSSVQTEKKLPDPAAFMMKLYKYSYKNTSHLLKQERTVINDDSTIDSLTVAQEVLFFLRCSRIVGESIYGFTPLSTDKGGDGQRMWSLLLDKPLNGTYNLIGLTTAVMLSPFIAGIGKATIDKMYK
jgi:Peptidase M50B-like